MYKLKIDKPNLMPGTELEIPGLGIFKNGKEYDIDDDQSEAFRAHHSRVVTDTDTSDDVDNRGTFATHTELGPTLLQAFRGEDGITVTTVKQSKKAQSEPGEQHEPEIPHTPEEPDNVDITAPDSGTVNEGGEG